MSNYIYNNQAKCNEILSIAKSVFHNEISGLKALANSLNNNFFQAVLMLHNRNARVIVSGIGKSGHVARKIAATLASTGQPAFFVHPAEAGHGDLGMITDQDKLLLISYSGETTELKTVIDYGKRFAIPIVSITGCAHSTLAKCSDVNLILPQVNEACPMGLAPTTSTTMMLALGDALAICMLSLANFTPTDFKVFHPGGNLGKQLNVAGHYMHVGEQLPLLSPSELMSECLVKMTSYGFGCMGIINKEKRLVGIITDGDLRRHMHPNLLSDSVEKIMTKNPVTITPDTLMAEALAIMQKCAITSIFVTDSISENPKPLGLLHIHDCLRAGIA